MAVITDIVDSIHNAAGTSALRMDSPLERKLRDAHGCATHRWVAHPLYAELGKIFLGHEAPAEFAGTGGPAPSPGRRPRRRSNVVGGQSCD